YALIEYEVYPSQKERRNGGWNIPCCTARILDRAAGSSASVQRTAGGTTERHAVGRRFGGKRHVAGQSGPGRHDFDDGCLFRRRFESGSSGMEDAGDVETYSVRVYR